jgi:hypothetical protein
VGSHPRQDRSRQVFTAIHGAGWEGARDVEVIDAGVAYDTPTFVLITPLTIDGLAFPPDPEFPGGLDIDGEIRVVHSVRTSDLGPYRAVNLAPVGSHFPSPAHALKTAERVAPEFSRAVRGARLLIGALRSH